MLAGLILAGGEGKRWGGPKAWAPFPDGRSFLEACTSTLRDAGAVRIAATLPPGSLDPAILELQALPLPEPGLDMFASLLFGITQVVQSEDWQRLVVLPVDHPLVRAQTVRRISEAEGTAVIPSYDGKHGHPILLDRGVVVSIVCGDLDGPTMREVLRAVGPVEVAVDDPGVITNCNTPEALEAAIHESGRP